jgi:GntR family transcriptional regulator / MocR family aminotransferase
VAGLHVTVPVTSVGVSRTLLAQAGQVEVEINGLSRYWLQDSVEPVDNRAGLVLGFAAVPEVEIKAALVRLEKGVE